MKTQNSFFTILMICLCSTSVFAQSGLQKTLISTVVPGESNMVFFELPGEVEVDVWDRDYIKVEIEVQTNLENEKVFNYLQEFSFLTHKSVHRTLIRIIFLDVT